MSVIAELRMRNVLRALAAEKIAPVALYGAGAHTAKVIRALLDSPIAIAGFVDDSPERQRTGVCGWPIVPTGEITRLGARAVVINTDRHEARIWERRRDLERQGLRVCRLYPELHGDPEPSDLPRVFHAATADKLSHGGVKEYWRSRGDESENAPHEYLNHLGWSVLVAEWLAGAGVPKDASVLELGCNIGRNLAWLRRCGWTRLSGIDLNRQAVARMYAYFPGAAAATNVEIGPMEEVLPTIADGAFDVCLTMAAFMCIHPAAVGAFREAARVTRRWMLTVEGEANDGSRYFPRNYRDVFAEYGWREARALAFADADADSQHLLGLQEGYVMRLLTRA